jgi:hypothetical protein
MVVAASSVQGNKRPGFILFFNSCCVSGWAQSYPRNSGLLFMWDWLLNMFTGFSTVWQGLECAAKCIVNNVSAETVQTVRYKWVQFHVESQALVPSARPHRWESCASF